MVPLMIARSSRMRFAARSSCSGAMMGMPPPTAASKRSSAPFFAASAISSGPCQETTRLFAVTTGRPRPSAAAIKVRAGSSPPRSSTTTSTSSARATAIGSVVSWSVGTGRGRVRSRTAAHCRTIGAPAARESTSRRSSSARATDCPTVPSPRSPMRIARIPPLYSAAPGEATLASGAPLPECPGPPKSPPGWTTHPMHPSDAGWASRRAAACCSSTRPSDSRTG